MASRHRNRSFSMPQVRRGQMPPPVACIRRLDQPLEYVEGRRLQPVAEQELLTPREFLHRRDQPQHEAVHRFQAPDPSDALPLHDRLKTPLARTLGGVAPQTPQEVKN